MKYIFINITLFFIFLLGACTNGENHQAFDKTLVFEDTVKVNASKNIKSTDRKEIDDSIIDFKEDTLSTSDPKISG